MKKIYLLIAILSYSWQAQAANDYPTEEIVRNVIGCMTALGGLTDTNMYTCSCRANHIMANMTFPEYDDALFFDRNKQMIGKRGGMVRDNEKGRTDSQKYEKVLQSAEKNCPVVKHIDPPRLKSQQSEAATSQ